MAGQECCKLVGNLKLGIDGCIISISTSCSTESTVACGDEHPLPGPTIGSLNITGYADTQIWVGCPCKAGLNLPYVRKYDCVNDVVYFIPNGQGQSFISGENAAVSVKYPLSSCTSINASSTSGPTTIYMETTQINGYGLSYTGGPISIETTTEMSPVEFPGIVEQDLYLQNFSFDAQPGQLPTVSYSFVYSM